MILLFVVSGALILGAIVAPVVFNSSLYLNEIFLTRFDNGLLMSEIFRRFSIVLNIVLLFVTLYHTYKYKQFLSSFSTIVFYVIFAISSLLFSFYFTEGVMSFIYKGELWINENIELFEAFHKASEIDFAIIMISALMLAINAYKKRFDTIN